MGGALGMGAKKKADPPPAAKDDKGYKLRAARLEFGVSNFAA
jgi:hypothetical protein